MIPLPPTNDSHINPSNKIYSSLGEFFNSLPLVDLKNDYIEAISRVSERGGKSSREIKVTVPAHWSQTAIDILSQKYLRRTGVPLYTVNVDEDSIPLFFQKRIPDPLCKENVFTGENHAGQVFHRLAGAWTYWGIKEQLLNNPDHAHRFYRHIFNMLYSQMAAPNSPQWFNTGLNWAYGILGESQGHYYVDDTGTLTESSSAYERAQVHACFILSIKDDLVNQNGIMDTLTKEARIFKYGSGTGSNFSNIRGKGENLSGGGKSSGLISFLKIGDRSAMSIKSGGTCLSPDTLIYDPTFGPRKVKDLTEKEFHVLSFDPPSNRFKIKTASAWYAGKKEMVRITTDKGIFETSYDHPFLLNAKEVKRACDLKVNSSLFNCTVSYNHNNYLRVGLKDGMKTKAFLHRMILEDIQGKNLQGLVVHHRDGNKYNNTIDNLVVITQAEHAQDHGNEHVVDGSFKLKSVSLCGSKNPMHKSSDFWKNKDKVENLKNKHKNNIKPRSLDMQDKAASQKMINTAYSVLNAGYSIDTFNEYVYGRQLVIGRIPSICGLKNKINNRFGSYEKFKELVSLSNHRVLNVEYIGESDVYDVEVNCSTADDKTINSGHNFVIWPNKDLIGSGVVVFNTRRSAKMVILNDNHPDIEEFINWKVKEEEKVAAMVLGAKIHQEAMQAILDAASPEEERQGVLNAQKVGISPNYIKKIRNLKAQGVKTYNFVKLDNDFEGESYLTVSGQGANNSVRISDAFIKALEKNGTYDLINRTDGKINKTILAKDLWDQINYASWHSADPGLQFDDTINDWHTCKADGRINASNPCCFTGDTAIKTDHGNMTFEALHNHSQNPIEPINALSYNYRTKNSVLRPISKVWIAGKTKKLVKVTTVKGHSFTCTPDHLFMTYEGFYLPAEILREGELLRQNSFELLVDETVSSLPEDHILLRDCKADELRHLKNSKLSDRKNFLKTLSLIEKAEYIAFWDRVVDANSHLKNKGVTPRRWNSCLDDNPRFKQSITVADNKTHRILGMSWEEFVQLINQARVDVYNVMADTVKSVEHIELKSEIAVYDLEVYDLHNFTITTPGANDGIIVHNSEYMFLDDTACNLASLNLVKFIDDNGKFNYKEFSTDCMLWTLVLEISVYMAQFPSKEIAQRSYDYRTLGLGYANLGALLMRQALPYDSEEARQVAKTITAYMHGSAYFCSALMAKEIGRFPRFDNNRQSMLAVIRNHAACVCSNAFKSCSGLNIIPPSINKNYIGLDILEPLINLWDNVINYGASYGFRNAQVTVLAPTGTIGLVMDCDTTGVEPDFALLKFKKLAGGGYMLIANQSIVPALKNLGYSEEEILKLEKICYGTRDVLKYAPSTRYFINEHIEGESLQIINSAMGIATSADDFISNVKFSSISPLVLKRLEEEFNNIKKNEDEIFGIGTIEDHVNSEHASIFACANKCGKNGKQYIAPMGHVKMMAAVQPFLSGAISKTVNLPSEITIEEIGDIHLTAYNSGLKSIALYRDTSKLSQPLNISAEEELHEEIEEPVQSKNEMTKQSSVRNPLPSRRFGYTQKVGVDGLSLFIRTGEYDNGDLGEIFLTLNKEGGVIRSLLDAFAITISIGLQHGVPLESYVEKLIFSKFEPCGMVRHHERIKACTSLIDLVMRDLAINYLKRDDLAHIKPDATTLELNSLAHNKPSSVSDYKKSGYTGEICRSCGSHRMRRSGTCSTCENCGTTSGCS